jgi:putative copper resistance protein D
VSLEAGLIASRFAHYLAACVLFGTALFPFYSYPNNAAGMSAPLAHWRRRSLLGIAAASLVSALAWLILTTANMSGDMSAAIDPAAVMSVLRNTSFGRLWTFRLLLNGAVLGVVAWRVTAKYSYCGNLSVLLLAGALLATLAGTGHTQENEGLAFIVHAGADLGHLLAAGAWLGGLFVLAFLIRQSLPDVDYALRRFSGMGSAAVAVLLASGLVNSWFLVGSLPRLTSTPYGQLLVLKLCLFAGMLGLAAANRFWLVPGLVTNRPLALKRLKRHVYGEQILGMLVLLIVGVIGMIEPAISR